MINEDVKNKPKKPLTANYATDEIYSELDQPDIHRKFIYTNEAWSMSLVIWNWEDPAVPTITEQQPVKLCC